MTEQVFLPAEIEQMAQNVSIEKRNEVQAVLNHVFNGVTKMRDQLDLVVVTDENDKTSMKMANTIRLGVRDARIQGAKEFDAKREELRIKMLSDKTEDSLWLKSRQVMEILTKEIEANAKWKEETKERIEAERKELKIHERIMKVLKFSSDVFSSEFENMSDSMFDLFLSGLEKQYNDKIEAEKQAEAERIEKGRILQLFAERKESIIDLWKYVTAEYRNMNLGELSDEQWNDLKTALTESKIYEDAENERVRLENERLQKESERKELELKAEREKAEKELKLQKELAEKEAKRLADIAEKQRIELEAKQKTIEETARIEREKAEAKQAQLEAEIKAKNEAELKAKQDIERKEKERIEAEKQAAKAPDKIKLTKWIESLNIAIPKTNDLSATVTASDISAKFEGFKKWAKSEIEKL